ncbi:hypothetical protein IAT38_005269 [Cryptococcus sp. DSM 104549]
MSSPDITFTFTDALWIMVDQVLNDERVGSAPNMLAVHATAYAIYQERDDAGTTDDIFISGEEVDRLYEAAYIPWWNVNPGDGADAAPATPDAASATPAADPAAAQAPTKPTKGKGKGKAIADHDEPSPSKAAVVGKKRPFVKRTQKFKRCANACHACRDRKCKCEPVPNEDGCLRCVEEGFECERRAAGKRMYGTQAACIAKMQALGLEYFRSRDKRGAAAAAAARALAAGDSSSSSLAGPSGTSGSSEEDQEEQDEEYADEAQAQPAVDYSHPFEAVRSASNSTALETPSASQDVAVAGYAPPSFVITPVVDAEVQYPVQIVLGMESWQQDEASDQYVAGFLSGFSGQEWVQPAVSELYQPEPAAKIDLNCIDPDLLKM